MRTNCAFLQQPKICLPVSGFHSVYEYGLLGKQSFLRGTTVIKQTTVEEKKALIVFLQNSKHQLTERF
jgi:uncharacterized protein YqgQ